VKRASKRSRLDLHIDWTRCDGRGLCTELLPAVLARDEWGYPLVRDGSRQPLIPRGAEDLAHAAVRRCPRLALSVVPSTSKPPNRRARAHR
jgi:ferredoxin